MADTSETDRDNAGARSQAMTVRDAELHAWFVREVLSLEASLTNFLRHNWRNKADNADLLQDIYVRVYDAARKGLPASTRSFVFTTARNLLVDRVRSERVIPLQTIENLEALSVAADIPAPDEHIIAREELRRVQAALSIYRRGLAKPSHSIRFKVSRGGKSRLVWGSPKRPSRRI